MGQAIGRVAGAGIPPQMSGINACVVAPAAVVAAFVIRRGSRTIAPLASQMGDVNNLAVPTDRRRLPPHLAVWPQEAIGAFAVENNVRQKPKRFTHAGSASKRVTVCAPALPMPLAPSAAI